MILPHALHVTWHKLGILEFANQPKCRLRRKTLLPRRTNNLCSSHLSRWIVTGSFGLLLMTLLLRCRSSYWYFYYCCRWRSSLPPLPSIILARSFFGTQHQIVRDVCSLCVSFIYEITLNSKQQQAWCCLLISGFRAGLPGTYRLGLQARALFPEQSSPLFRDIMF